MNKKIKIFDVVKLKNNEIATILNISGNTCLVDIAGEEKLHKIIKIKEIKDVIYTK